MRVTATAIPDVLLFEPKLYDDERGFFFESYNEKVFEQHAGFRPRFVQDNYSHSKQRVLRGLHYQIEQAQGKLVRVLAGEVFDVAVDLRHSSQTFGRWVGVTLSATNHASLWVPAGFAHGFVVLSTSADFLYKTTDFYAPQHERAIRWDDSDLAIDWPLDGAAPLLNTKDAAAQSFAQAEKFA
jgi:dTDP-4-dehydrorhamnose 3,5-epimerase